MEKVANYRKKFCDSIRKKNLLPLENEAAPLKHPKAKPKDKKSIHNDVFQSMNNV
jgi:hypothetical protein